MPQVIMRPRLDGTGVSECSSPEDRVGMGRCVHMLSEAGSTMTVERTGWGKYRVQVNDSKLNMEGEKKAVQDFFNTLPEFTKSQRDSIIRSLDD
jgi:hypothetical protein